MRMDVAQELHFETTIRMFLGKKAYHIAGQVHSEKNRREWFAKALTLVLKRVHELDTTTKHKEALVSCAERALRTVKDRNVSEVECSVALLRLIGQLLGFVNVRGAILHTPTYHQSPGQHYTEVILDGEDAMQDYYDRNNAIAIRKRLVEQLKSEGFSDFQISMVLNTTEYQVKKLRKGL